MDSEIPWLGSGAKPVDRIIWGKADGVFIKKKKPGRLTLTENRPSLIPEAGCGQSPQKAVLEMPFFEAKKSEQDV
jgi:hypothetical protein